MVDVASLLPLEWGETEAPTGPCNNLQFPEHSAKALWVCPLGPIAAHWGGTESCDMTCPGHQELPAIPHAVSCQPPRAAQAD